MEAPNASYETTIKLSHDDQTYDKFIDYNEHKL